jgi:urease accessory protein
MFTEARSSLDHAAQLDLRFDASPAGETYLSKQRAGYPFHVGRLLQCEELACPRASVIIQSSSGGIFENDNLRQRFETGPHSAAQVTSAAATIVHTMTTGRAVSNVCIEAHRDARFDYLPHPTILFPHADFVSEIDVTLHPGAVVFVLDSYLGHDPDGREASFGRLETCITIRDFEGRLRSRDRLTMEGRLIGRVGLGGVAQAWRSHGGLLALTLDGDAQAITSSMNRVFQHEGLDSSQVYAGAGELPGSCGAFARVLARDGQSLQKTLRLVLNAGRQCIYGASESRSSSTNQSSQELALEKTC